VLDALRDRVAAQASFELLCLVVAAWLVRVTSKTGETGREIVVRHPLAAELAALHSSIQSGDCCLALGITSLFGALGQNEKVVELINGFLVGLTTEGVRSTVEKALAAV
jgi:mannitol-1-phosphate/altronate dehydrogenase